VRAAVGAAAAGGAAALGASGARLRPAASRRAATKAWASCQRRCRPLAIRGKPIRGEGGCNRGRFSVCHAVINKTP
jgi:hypothetical protein